MRHYGSEELLPQAAQFQILAGELQALAVVVAHERFGPECFGQVSNLEEHQRTTAKLRETLHGLYEQMRGAFCGSDLTIDMSEDRLLPDERKRGLAHVSFRKAPDVILADPDWPTQLVQDAMAAPSHKPKRERITKAA